MTWLRPTGMLALVVVVLTTALVPPLAAGDGARVGAPGPQLGGHQGSPVRSDATTDVCPLPSPTKIPGSVDGPTGWGASNESGPGAGNGTESTTSDPHSPERDPLDGSPLPDIGTIGPNGRMHGFPSGVVATLFSRDADEGFVTDATFAARYGWNRSGVAATANGSDVTFARPPPIARQWTTVDFTDLESGAWNTSRYPVGTETATRRYKERAVIRDAHATIFAAQPSTVAHLGPDIDRLYLRPQGTLLGLVDYRVTVPPLRTIPATGNGSVPRNGTVLPGTRRVAWCLDDATVQTVTLRETGTPIARTSPNGTDGTVAVNYTLEAPGETTLQLVAEIRATLRKRTDRYRCIPPDDGPGPGNRSCEWVSNTTRTVELSLTVDDTITGTVYDLTPSLATVRYPDPGDETGIMVFQDAPWQGYVIGNDAADRVSGVWRFYTARDTSWDVLMASNATTTERIHSPALPVYVHAVPSKLGPTVEDRRDVRILDSWGERVPSPRGTLAETVHVGTVPNRYTPTWGLAVRTEERDAPVVTVHGIVAGVTETVRPREGDSTRRIHNTTIEAEVVTANRSAAVVEIRLHATASGRPIALSEPPSGLPFRDRSTARDRRGYVRVGDRVVETGPDGVARVVVERPGVYDVRYVSESWVTADPAYAGSTTSVRWQPADEFGWWLRSAVRLLEFALPFVLLAYAARRFGRLLSYERL